jgi:hypothetical protein
MNAQPLTFNPEKDSGQALQPSRGRGGTEGSRRRDCLSKTTKPKRAPKHVFLRNEPDWTSRKYGRMLQGERRLGRSDMFFNPVRWESRFHFGRSVPALGMAMMKPLRIFSVAHIGGAHIIRWRRAGCKALHCMADNGEYPLMIKSLAPNLLRTGVHLVAAYALPLYNDPTNSPVTFGSASDQPCVGENGS